MAQARERDREKESLYRRNYYRRNLRKELKSSAERTKQSRAKESAWQAATRRERHRQAQARYREKNGLKLIRKSYEARLNKKLQKARDEDEEEFQRLMAEADRESSP